MTEYYCPKEICELLKEKGFNEFCNQFFDCVGELVITHHFNYKNNDRHNIVCQPTQDMVLSWLRINFNIYVHSFILPDRFYSLKVVNCSGAITYSSTYFTEYNQAIDVGIFYALSNMIKVF